MLYLRRFLQWCRQLWLRLFDWLRIRRLELPVAHQVLAEEFTDEIDTSYTLINGEALHTASFARIYDMTAKRRWQWLRNLVFLRHWQQPSMQVVDADVRALFEQKRELLAETDLSFERNPLEFIAGDAWINTRAFSEYLQLLAHYRHYHLFAQVLMSILKKNSVSTYDLLQDLLHCRQQLHDNMFFKNQYTLLYVPNKSQQWIASLMCRILPQHPQKIKKISCSVGGVQSLAEHETFLLCDDICYTGTQAILLLQTLHYGPQRPQITLLFARMSLYALAQIKQVIRERQWTGVQIMCGRLFFTLDAQLDGLPRPATVKEKHIIKQLLEADYCTTYTRGDFCRKPLLTTAWKRPDFVSSYFKFLGFSGESPEILGVSSALLSRPPRQAITFFAPEATPRLKITGSFIDGPKPPYH